MVTKTENLPMDIFDFMYQKYHKGYHKEEFQVIVGSKVNWYTFYRHFDVRLMGSKRGAV